MRTIRAQNRFRKDLDLLVKRGIDIGPVEETIGCLLRKETLPPNAKPHPLKGSWNKYRELHIGGDLLLIYQLTKKELVLVRVGNHSDLFQE